MTTTTASSRTATDEVGLLVQGQTSPRLSPTHLGRALACIETAFVALTSEPETASGAPVPPEPELTVVRLAYRNPLEAALIVAGTTVTVATATVRLIGKVADFRAQRRIQNAEAQLAEAHARSQTAKASQDELDTLAAITRATHELGRARADSEWLDQTRSARPGTALDPFNVDAFEADLARQQRLLDLLSSPMPAPEDALLNSDVSPAVSQQEQDLYGAEETFGLPPGTLTRPDVLYALAVLADAQVHIRVVTQAEATTWEPPR